MHLLAIPFTLLELASFIIACVAFLLAVRFFIASRKKLRELLPDGAAKRSSSLGIEIDRDGFLVPAKPRKAAEKEQRAAAETKQELKELRDMIQLQQLELARVLRQMETRNAAKETEAYNSGEAFIKKEESANDDYSGGDDFLVEELRNRVAERDATIEELQHEVKTQQKLKLHLDAVQASNEALQDKVHEMESEERQSAGLVMQLDKLEQEVEQLQKTVHKKEEKIRELTVENARLYERLNGAENKLSDVGGQRQQLLKKVAYLEEMANDLQQISEANRRLKTEVRRVGELESMLDLITEERDLLLKRKRV